MEKTHRFINMAQFAAITPHANNVVHFVLSGNPDISVFEAEFLRPLDALLANKNRFSLVIDAQGVSGVAMPVAWVMIKWMRANREKLKLHLRASGVVLMNDAVKSIMAFVLSVQTPAAPMRIFNTVAEAWTFVGSYE